MSTAYGEVEAQALRLEESERAALVEKLMESLAAPKEAPEQASWLELAKKRRDEVRSGAVAAVPGEEGSAMVRGLVGR